MNWIKGMVKKVFGGLFDTTTFLPRLLRGAALGAALWFSGDQAGALDALLAALGAGAGLIGAGEMNK
jgi:hypothetical protein